MGTETATEREPMTSTTRYRHQGTWGPIETISERTSVRHGLAESFELGRAAGAWDNITHPFTNWGYRDSLAHTLANHRRFSAIKTGRTA